MPWPSTTNSTSNDPPPDPWHKAALAQLTQPAVLLTSAGLTLASLGSIRVYKRNLRRISSIGHVKPEDYRKKSIFGKVTSVGDGDNFRLYHTPGGRWAGWGWGRSVPGKREDLKDQTVCLLACYMPMGFCRLCTGLEALLHNGLETVMRVPNGAHAHCLRRSRTTQVSPTDNKLTKPSRSISASPELTPLNWHTLAVQPSRMAKRRSNSSQATF
jgi:hypothetical protein